MAQENGTLSDGLTVARNLVVLERYRLLRRLGAGGMGKVYEAEHVHLGTRHAVKALSVPADIPEDYRQDIEIRFLREAKICATVSHPNLVPVTDFGTSDGVPYIVMGLIDGEDLQKIVDTGGPLPEDTGLRILHDIALAVESLHEHGILHRDLKPANVMLERKSGRVVLTDLGIAKDLSGHGGQATVGILGTPAYMAPEQMTESPDVGFVTDIYALGGTLFTLLCGRPPFEAQNPLVLLRKALDALQTAGSLAPIMDEIGEAEGLSFTPAILSLVGNMTRNKCADRINSCKVVVQICSQMLRERESDAESDRERTWATENIAILTRTFGPSNAISAVSVAPSASASNVSPPPSPVGAAGTPAPSASVSPASAPVAVAPASKESARAEYLVAALAGDAYQGTARPVARRVSVSTWILGVCVVAGIAALAYARFGRRPDIPIVVDPPAEDGGVAKTPPAARNSSDVDPPLSSKVAVAPAAEHATKELLPVAKTGGPIHEAEAPRVIAIPLPGAGTLTLVLVPSGSFTIGPESSERGKDLVRHVKITRPFYIGQNEVTTSQFASFLNSETKSPGSLGEGDTGLVRDGDSWRAARGEEEMPVRNVSHDMARSFCRWLSTHSGLAAGLPGEVEWEYAARGPESSIYPWGDFWEEGRCRAKTGSGPAPSVAKVGSYPSGRSWCGAEDMAGNVFEWCADRYKARRYVDLPGLDPGVLDAGSSSGLRVFRGGCFGSGAGVCRASYRNGLTGTSSDRALGFRVKVEAREGVRRYAAQGH